MDEETAVSTQNGNSGMHYNDNDSENSESMDMEATQLVTVKVENKGWRNGSEGLKTRFMYMLDNAILTDVTFLIGTDKDTVTAHRFVLSLWSAAFEAMPENVEIPEINMPGFKSFLKYLYTEEFEVSSEDLMPVLCTAKRFEVTLLTDICVAALKREIKPSTAVSMYQAGKLLGEPTLSEDSLAFILQNGTAVVREEDFKAISFESLYSLIERDDFEVDELDLFKAVYNWALNQCKAQDDGPVTPSMLRDALQDIILGIRFPLISPKDFALHVAPTEILHDKELIGLLIQYSIPASERASMPTPKHQYSDVMRKSSQPAKKRPKMMRSSTAESTLNLDGVDPPKPDVNGFESKYTWRDGKGGIQANLNILFESGLLSDVTFLVGKTQKKLYAHSFILKMWSPTFEEMFPPRTQRTYIIELPEFTPESFGSFLKVLYTEHFDVAVENVMAVFWIARKYGIASLGEKCLAVLKNSVGDTTAISIFQAAKSLEDDSLAEVAWAHILNRGFAVVRETDFANLSFETLSNLVEHNDFNVGELELFVAVLKWAQLECDRRDQPKTPASIRAVLGKALHAIRFPLMSVKDFSLHVAPTEILTESEMVGVLIYYNLPPSERSNAHRLVFNTHERKNKGAIVKERVRLCNLSLKTDRTISIVGLCFSGIDATKLGYAPTSIYLYSTKKGMSFSHSFTETVIIDEGKDRFAVRFRMPIVLQPNEWYIASEMTLGQKASIDIKKDHWIAITSRQKDVNFQFHIHPLSGTDGLMDYAMPEVLFSVM